MTIKITHHLDQIEADAAAIRDLWEAPLVKGKASVSLNVALERRGREIGERVKHLRSLVTDLSNQFPEGLA